MFLQRHHFSISLIFLPVVLLGTDLAVAREVNCTRDAEEARRACTSKDAAAGTSDGGSEMNRLTSELNGNNQQVSQFSESQSAQFQNQRQAMLRIADLSRQKAQACVSAMAQCMASCSNVASFYKHLGKVYSQIGDAAGESEVSSQSDAASEQKETCRAYSENVRRASEQMAQANAAANTNGTGHSDTKSDAQGAAGASSAAANADRDFAQRGEATDSRSALGGATSAASSAGSGFSEASGGASPGGAQSQPMSAASTSSLPLITSPTQSDVRPGVGAPLKRGVDSRRTGGETGGATGAAAISGATAGLAGATRAPASLLLRKFPGKASRAVAAGPDGVTGATGPSLFEKISHQYRLQAGTMIQEDR